MQFISLFSGAGGLDLGLEAAGLECLLATDHNADAIETLRINKYAARLDTRIVEADIRNLTGKNMLAAVGRPRGDVPVLAGGPPCQSWSSGGLQLGFADPRGRLVEEYLRIASEIDARWLVFENVRGLLTARGLDGKPGTALAAIRSELLRRGWQTKVELLNAADFGVAQRRNRLIILGYRAGDGPTFPTGTHAQAEWVSMRNCLATIEPVKADEIIRPTGKMAEELRDIVPGSGVKSPGKAETTRPGGHWGYKQGAFVADLDRPARTVTASSQQDWIRDPVYGLRRLCPRECAALQGFPAHWAFSGKRVSQYRQIGNAVPPALAQAVGTVLMAHDRASPEISARWSDVAPLPYRLQSAVRYTEREEARNGDSRRSVSKRPSATAVGS
ncbi:MAG: DNA cytosine methyltransferase [Pseudomonadota bacterium]